MKSIAMMTVHQSINCGASLQASALYETLKRVGMNPCVINYCPPYLLPLTDDSNKHVRKTPKGMVKTLLLGGRIKRNAVLFREYAEEFYPNTTKRFESVRDINLSDYNFDYYICGSDQIWNPTHVRYDDAWFFSFVRGENAKLVSYAASIGKDELNEDDCEWLRKGLSRYSRIGVREDTCVEIVRKLGFASTQNMDPTLLISRSDWRKRAQEPSIKLPPRYILHYPIESNPIERQLLDQLRHKYGLKIITMTDSLKYSLQARKCVSEYGPKQFLYLIDHADIVLTNSFHGLVFSMIFGKKLVSFRSMTKNSRLGSLFRTSGLDGYQVTSMDDFAARDLEYDQQRLSNAYESLVGPIDDSLHFLKSIKEL